jgi:AAA+ ATPase superfamily predicted ATPase
MKFRNRDRHLQILNQHYERRQASFMVVYGRRRIGKTVLLRHWIENHLSGRHLLWSDLGGNGCKSLCPG